MSPFPARARIAPIAFLVVFGFVVVGFLKADNDMVRGERERAASKASESAALLESFLFRQVALLRMLQVSMLRNSPQNTAKIISLPDARNHSAFEALLVLDSVGNQHDRWLRTDTIGAPITSPSRAQDVTEMFSGQELAGATRRGNDTPIVVADRDSRLTRLVIGLALDQSQRTTLLGVLLTDSLTAGLGLQGKSPAFGVIVHSEGDTIIRALNQHSISQSQSVNALVNTPFDRSWTLTMLYSPSGRGVRITLWVVGLGAVIGLGIGLLLERREASRIADRSSELEHLSTELLRANRAKSEFLANVSHELRTPLNAIVGFVDLLRDGVYGTLNARQVGPVERIEASANHLRHLVDQVLDLAKMAAGRLEVHTEPIELRPFVFDVASEVEPLITEKGLHFSLTIGATLPRVRTDPTHLRQILINLLGNAVKFTNTGSISVRGKLVGTETRSGLPSVLNVATSLLMRSPRPDGLWIVLQVVDSGIGIPEKDRERIFDEFEQVNAGPRGDSMRRGTGLGLSISRRLARLIGGDITVESEVDRGSIFTVWLPVDPADLQGDRAA